MRKFLLFILLIAFNFSVFGQLDSLEKQVFDIEILKTKNYKKGIYMSFKEFQDNNPSIKNKILVKESNELLQVFFGATTNILALYNDSTNKFKRFRKENWGACDGDNIYIRFHGNYFKVSLDGKYSYFEEYGYGTGDNYYDNDYVLNIITNECIRLTKKNITKLLEKEDRKLLEEFENENKKKTKLTDYVLRVNSLYK